MTVLHGKGCLLPICKKKDNKSIDIFPLMYYNKDTRKGKESIAMKTVRELIDEAKAKHLDVCIETREGAYEEVFGGGWAAVGEYYWMKEEQFFDGCAVLGVKILDEGIMIITVNY